MMETNELPDPKAERWGLLNAELSAYGTKTEGRPPHEDVPIDPDIVEAVAGLNALGIKTTASCAGHTDESLSFPMLQGILVDDEADITQRIRIEELLDEFNVGRTDEYKLALHSDVTSGYRIESSVTEKGAQEVYRLFALMTEEDQAREKDWVEHLENDGREQVTKLINGAQAEFAELLFIANIQNSQFRSLF